MNVVYVQVMILAGVGPANSAPINLDLSSMGQDRTYFEDSYSQLAPAWSLVGKQQDI